MSLEFWCFIFIFVIQEPRNTQSSHPNLTITIYYESKCPYSRVFITQQLYPTMLKIDSSELFVVLIPYGSSMATQRSDGGWDFTCHHGIGECEENIWHACALKYLKKAKIQMAFISCLMAQSYKTYSLTAAKMCSHLASKEEMHLLVNCAEGREGEELHHQYGVLTQVLTPQPQFLPWILFNGVSDEHLMDLAYSDLHSLVCEILQPHVPRSCGNSTEFKSSPHHQIDHVKPTEESVTLLGKNKTKANI